MVALDAPLNPTLEGLTERFDPIDCLDERVRNLAAGVDRLQPGRYLGVQGPGRAIVIPLEEEIVRIGRGIAADLRLDESSVSRRHAIVELSPAPRILDDRSSNGTFVNGERIQQAELAAGDLITVGRVTLRYLEVT